MSKLKSSKTIGLIVLLLIYILAAIGGILSFVLLQDYIKCIYFNILISNTIATFIVFIAGLIFKTASTYDPYWSLQTVVIYIALLFKFNNFNFANLLFLGFILFWAVRLTINFIKGFNNLTYVDWRYKMIQNKCGKLYPIVNFLGICLMPTIIVYLASLPAFYFVINSLTFNPLQIIGLIIMFIATMLELISDIQMKKFIKIRKDRSEIINFGLWKYVRHPNYLGEIMFWYGVALVLIIPNISLHYYLIGAIVNTLLFIFISIPMEENHFKSYKPNYEIYKKNTSCLIPIKCLSKKEK